MKRSISRDSTLRYRSIQNYTLERKLVLTQHLVT